MVEGLYERSVMVSYQEKHIGELPPHVYAIANECYYSMWKKGESQCVLIRYKSLSHHFFTDAQNQIILYMYNNC